jgi:hypothetical protein
MVFTAAILAPSLVRNLAEAELNEFALEVGAAAGPGTDLAAAA